MQIVPYLTFNGNCEEALGFYQGVFGGEPDIMRFREIPPQEGIEVSDRWKEKIMHAELVIDDQLLYFSDTFEGMEVTAGDSVTVHINVDSEEELRRLFSVLSEGGKVTMPVDTMFWGAVYGSLTDKFGINWGFDYAPEG